MARVTSPHRSAGQRLILCLALGVLVALLFSGGNSIAVSFLIGWVTFATAFVAWVLILTLPMTSDQTSRYALREDPSRRVTDAILVVASLASLVAVIAVLLELHDLTGAQKLLDAIIGVVSVVVSWLLVHTVYMLRYAGLYYSPHVNASIDFNDGKDPSYADFAYISYTLGMTYQVSDTALRGTKFRTTVLKHTLLSYVFGTIIIATTINLIASLAQ